MNSSQSDVIVLLFSFYNKKEGKELEFMTKETFINICRTVIKNAVHFISILAFIRIFALLFGTKNMLPGIAIQVGMQMFPSCNIIMKPKQFASFIFALYFSCGLIAAFSLSNLWLGCMLNFVMVAIILLFTCEPKELGLQMPFLLCYIFCQVIPVYGQDLVLRLLGLAIGAIFVVVVTLYAWQKRGYGARKMISLPKQIKLCAQKP